MRIHKLVLSVWLITLIPLLQGCALFLIGAGVAAGVGAVAYVNGELRGTEQVSLATAYASAVKTLNELELKVTEQQKDALSGKVIARRADGTVIGVYVNKKTADTTEIRIRVGTFGDEALSKVVYEKIKKNL
jgi:hypothetical protein